MALKEFIQRCLEQNAVSLFQALDGLTPQELAWSPSPQCMSIAFIVWHTSRAEDWLIHTLIPRGPQLWEKGWAERFHRPQLPRWTWALASPRSKSRRSGPRTLRSCSPTPTPPVPPRSPISKASMMPRSNA